MPAYNTIAFKPDRCTGCADCMLACAQVKAGTDDTRRSRIQIMPGIAEEDFGLAMCRQCADPKCVTNCPAAALAKNGNTGVIINDD